MPMYKDDEITSSFIQEKFPQVAAEIVANASNEQVSITLDSIRESHPEIVTALQKEGAATATIDTATQERERINSIQALSQVGYEKIIAAAIEDGVSAAEQVKIKLFDAMNETRTTTHANHRADGESLGKEVIELSGGSEEGGDDSVSEDDKAVASMAEAGKKSRGEM